MTIEEAIRAIKHDLRWKLLKDYQQDVADMAISALEKQIPKKHRCPSCDGHDIEDVFIEKINFCPFCGQALDWESDNDD